MLTASTGSRVPRHMASTLLLTHIWFDAFNNFCFSACELLTATRRRGLSAEQWPLVRSLLCKSEVGLGSLMPRRTQIRSWRGKPGELDAEGGWYLHSRKSPRAPLNMLCRYLTVVCCRRGLHAIAQLDVRSCNFSKRMQHFKAVRMIPSLRSCNSTGIRLPQWLQAQREESRSTSVQTHSCPT